VVTGATLRNDAEVVGSLFCGGQEVVDAGVGGELNCGDDGDGVNFGSGAGGGMLPWREVCWRKMLLSWSSWCH
jgi:hypothetical protein